MMASRYGWVIVAAGGFMGCVAIGAVFTLPVFQQPMVAATGWSRTGISLAGGLLVDHFNSYTGLYAGSFVLGLAAAAMMLTYRPAPVPA